MLQVFAVPCSTGVNSLVASAAAMHIAKSTARIDRPAATTREIRWRRGCGVAGGDGGGEAAALGGDAT